MMKGIKKILALLLSLTLSMALWGCATQTASPSSTAQAPAATASTSAAGKTYTIGLSLASTTNNPYLMALSGAVQSALEAKGYKVILQDADMDAAKQSTQFGNLVTQKVDLIVYWPHDTAAAVADAKKAFDAGIPVVNFFVPANDEAKQYMKAYVGASQYDVGAALADYANKLLAGKGSYVVVNGMEGAPDFQFRSSGFSETLAKLGDYTKLAEEYTHSDRTKAQTVMENFLTTYPSIDLVFCGSDDFGMGAYNAISASGRTPFILGIDGTEQCLQLIKEGKWTATVYQTVDMMGEKVADVSSKLLAKETVDYNETLPIIVVDKNNIDQYLK